MPWKVIEFQDEAGDIMVARMPQQGTAELVSGSQVVVQDGQLAAFFHNGRPTDLFRAGRYPLSTENLPLLSKALNLVSLGRSPFRSYVYFIALKTFTNLGWGTASPILFRDSEFRVVNIRAYGSFAIRIAEPRTFLFTLVGTQGLETSHAIEEYLRKLIVAKFAQVLPTVMTTVIDLPSRYDDLAVEVKQAVTDQFDQYGLALVDLIVEAVTVPPEVQDAINRAAGIRAVGRDEVDHYERVMRTDALRDAASLPGSAAGQGLAAGLGAGAGLGMAKDMMQSAGGTAEARGKLTPEQVKARLRELKDMLAEELIDQADFDAAKRDLLDRL